MPKNNKSIAILIPTFKRIKNLNKLIDSFHKTTTQASMYFIVSPEDTNTIEYLKKRNANLLICSGEYVECINYGFSKTQEEFVLIASDDIEFTLHWDIRMLFVMNDPKINITGGLDDWEVSKSGVHISHPLVRRNFIKGDVYFKGYTHYMCDTEFVQRGWKDNCVRIIPQTLIHHRHPEVKTAPNDKTYQRSSKHLKKDWATYNKRRSEFEMWDTKSMHKGVALPTEINPLFKRTLISIIIPVKNAKKYLEQTLLSLFDNTYFQFELILIDDDSDSQTVNFINSLEVDSSYKKCLNLIKVFNSKQEWCNYNWNLGVEIARGNYIAILNSDIELSKNWDLGLVRGLMSATIACPYERNSHSKKAFKLDPLIEQNCPNMIKGACFMFKSQDAENFFPISYLLKHWCGDNWIADEAERMKGVIFVRDSVIFHHTSASAKTINFKTYVETIYQDLENYEMLSGKDMSWLKSTFIWFKEGIKVF